jgi:ATP-dependent helicase/nuclease subunit B
MAARPVRPKRPAHPRLFIWGQLEARLQQTDLTILAGLNDGVWPSGEEPGPWLNPSMRDGLGLPPLERRVGQAAHDFVQAAAGGEVVLSRAEKDLDGSPTVPSRWLVRLKACLAAGGLDPEKIAEDSAWQSWALSLDQPTDAVRPEPQPKPAPPVADRPRRLAVSDIERWMKNPYGLYARRILGLQPLEALEADPGAADRGMIIHKVLERFVKAYPRDLPDDALARLLDFGVQAFARYNQRPQVRSIWWPRFLRVAAWVVAREAEVRGDLVDILAEVKGELVIEAPAGPFRLTARADRLERRADGGVQVVDYKTGAAPAKADMKNGLAPQLPLEGMMLQQGAFADLDGQSLSGLQFWQLSGGEDGGRLEPRAVELALGVLESLTALIRHYDKPATAYPASYRPPTARREDYDHLARLGEWPN